jgi:hypothetical protein
MRFVWLLVLAGCAGSQPTLEHELDAARLDEMRAAYSKLERECKR